MATTVEFYEVNKEGDSNGKHWGLFELENIPQKGDGVTIADYHDVDHYFRVVSHYHHPTAKKISVGIVLVGTVRGRKPDGCARAF